MLSFQKRDCNFTFVKNAKACPQITISKYIYQNTVFALKCILLKFGIYYSLCTYLEIYIIFEVRSSASKFRCLFLNQDIYRECKRQKIFCLKSHAEQNSFLVNFLNPDNIFSFRHYLLFVHCLLVLTL